MKGGVGGRRSSEDSYQNRDFIHGGRHEYCIIYRWFLRCVLEIGVRLRLRCFSQSKRGD